MISVVYEDKSIVVIDKPAGMVVNRAESVKGKTIQDWMEERYQELGVEREVKGEADELFKNRSGLVHRLDKDTSGVMVVAKTPGAMIELMRQFKERETEKIYLALVHGKLSPSKGEVRVPLARTSKDRRKFGVVVGGKMSKTSYEVIKEDRVEGKGYDDGFSLVKLMPKTGRTHQLRVVLKHLGHAIVGDKFYLSKKRARADGKWCLRQFLHAKKLCFDHPETSERKCFETKLPEDLKKALEFLGWKTPAIEN